MPVSFNSPPRNLFLLGSGGQQALTNFFHTINRAGSDRFNVSDIAYSDTDQKYILAGSAKDSNTVSFGWMEKQAYDAETDPENPVNVEDWRRVFHSPANTTNTSTTLNFMKQTASYGGDIIIGGKTGSVPWISKYNASGAQQWVSTSQSGDVEYFGVACTTTGYYACGHKTGVGVTAEGFVEKWTTTGTPLWGKSAIHINGEVKLNKIAANERGEVVVVGSVTDQAYKQGYLSKIDMTTGDILWDRTINSGVSPSLGFKNDVEVNNVYIDGNDQIYIIGTEFADTFPVYKKGFIIKYSAEGNLIWHKTTPSFENHDFLDIWSDTPVEQTVVLSRETLPANGNDNLSLIKYSKNGDVVFRRRIISDTNYVQPTAGLDGDPSFYYMLFVEEVDDVTAGSSKNYTFGKVSASGNGFGAFTYETAYEPATGMREIDYVVNTNTPSNPIGRLADGSVRNDSSDFISYPYSGLNLLLGDDLATNVAYKKTRHKEKDLFDYHGSPAIRPVDNSSLDIGSKTITTTTTTGGPAAQGQQAYTTPGSYTWTAPANVTSVDVVCVGGGSGCGGALAYKNDITVVPGTGYSVVVGDGGINTGGAGISTPAGGDSSFTATHGTTTAQGGRNSASDGATKGSPAGSYDGGGDGGITYGYGAFNGAGAGGYSGNGGGGGPNAATGQFNGSGGGGGAGHWAYSSGGGVGILGEGASGLGGSSSNIDGQGGSGGQDGQGEGVSGTSTMIGGLYGGGCTSRWVGNQGGSGAVRIIWGSGRAFPSTNTADVTPSSGPTTTTVTKVADQSGNGLNGTIEGAIQANIETKGWWQFDGINDYISFPESSSFSFANDDFTIESWIYPTNSVVFANIFSTEDFDFKLQFLAVRIYTSGGSNTSATCNLNEWNHVLFYRKSSTFYVSINGVEETVTPPAFTGDGSSAANIGRKIRSASEYFPGNIAEVRVYQRALTTAEIHQNYNSRKSKYLGLANETRPDITSVIIDPSLKLNCDFGDPILYSKSNNLIPWSIDDGKWNEGSNGTLTRNAGVAPDGTMTATKAVASSSDIDTSPSLGPATVGGSTQIPVEGGKPYTFSIWVKASTPEQVGELFKVRWKRITGDTKSIESVFMLTENWTRRSCTTTTAANNTTAAVYIGGVVGSEALVWGAQFEQNDSPTNYVATYGTPVPKPTYSVPKSISGYTGTPLNQAHSSSLSTYENITYDQDDGAFVFNGVDSSLYWSHDHIDTFPGLVAGFTLEAWINTNSFTTTAPPPGNQHSRIIGLGGTGLSGDMAIMPTGKLRGRGGGAQALEEALDPDAMNLNQWYHVVTTLSEERYVKIYRDGVLKDTYDHGVGNASFNANPKAISIGRYVAGGNSMQYDGKIGQARAYARSLSATEILNNFEATRSRYGV